MRTKDEIKADLERLKKEYQKAAQTEFKAGLADLFAKHEDLKSIAWPQYTPWFNDGDECTFSVHNDYPEINGFSEYGEDGDGEGVNILKNSRPEIDYPRKPNPDFDPNAAKIIADIKEFLGMFDEDAYKDMFGDHVKVTATREGVKADEYSHD